MPTNEQVVIRLQIASQENKAAYKSALNTFLKAESSTVDHQAKVDSLNTAHGEAVKYFNSVEAFVRDSRLLGAHDDAEWIVEIAEDCHEVLKTILLYHRDFLPAACKRLGLRYEDYLPGPTAYASMQRLAQKHLGDLASNMQEAFAIAGLPTRGFTGQNSALAAGTGATLTQTAPASRAVVSTSELRRVLRERFPLPQDFDSFCLDEFPTVYSKFTGNMDRTSRENVLLQGVPAPDIAAALTLVPGVERNARAHVTDANVIAPIGGASPSLSAAAIVGGLPSDQSRSTPVAPDVNNQARGRAVRRLGLPAIAAIVILAAIVVFIVRTVTNLKVSDVPPCEIAPPQSSHAASAQKVAGDLQGVAKEASPKGGLTTEAREVLDHSFNEVPERDVVCQMIVQASVCLEKSNKPEAAREMRSYIGKKCADPPPTVPTTEPPAVVPDVNPKRGSKAHSTDLLRKSSRLGSIGTRSASCETSRLEFARGYCAVAQCPVGWVRGSVKVFPDGQAIAELQLETDDLLRGPCGYLTWEIRDEKGGFVGKGRTEKQCLGGKPPGKALIKNFEPVVSAVGVDQAARTRQVIVEAKCAD